MRSLLRTRHVVLGVVSTALVCVVALRPELLGGQVRDAVAGLGHAEPGWLWVALLALVLMHAVGGLAWNAALQACRSATAPVDAVARYAVGSGVNALAPGHVGSGLRLALFARVAPGDGACWRVAGGAVSVGAVRSAWLASVIATGALLGGVPAWPLALIATGLLAAVLVAAASRRIRSGRRVAHVLDAARELGRSPASLARVAALTGAGMAVKIVAAGCVCASLGVPHPFVAALVVVPAVEIAAVLPLTPGNLGVSSAAVAFALAARDVDAETALAAGIAFGAVETLAAVAVGAAGVAVLSAPRMRPLVRRAAVGLASGAVWSAVVLTALPGV